MTPPAAEQQDQALASLTGADAAAASSGFERDMLRLRLAAEAKRAGIPWSVIGAALGMSGKEAKRHMKQLARATQRELLARQGR